MTRLVRVYVIIIAIVLAMVTVMAGCVSTQPGATPAVKILSPPNGAAVAGGNVTVTVQVTNFNVVDKQGQASVPGEGHLHFYLDVIPIPSIPGQPAIPPNANATWAHVSGTTYTFTNVPQGIHTFSVQLVNNDHTPVIPEVIDNITITVTRTPGAPEIGMTSPRESATLPAGNVTVTVAAVMAAPEILIISPSGGGIVGPYNFTISVEVKNFNLADRIGQVNVPGEGHIVYYLDVAPPISAGTPAIPASGMYAISMGTSNFWDNVPIGTHEAAVELVNNDNTPLVPPATDSIPIVMRGLGTPGGGGGGGEGGY